MRGQGEYQDKIKEKNLKKVLFAINQAMANNRFCTISNIRKWTKLNHESIRNYLKLLIESGDVVEYQVYNNARGFLTSSVDKKIRLNKMLLLEFDENTESDIYKKKYPNLKSSKIRKDPMVKKLEKLVRQQQGLE